MGKLTQSRSNLILGDILFQSGCFHSILMICYGESDILLRYMFPVAEKKEDDSWQRNPGGVWMASQDKVGYASSEVHDF